jgi:hypothetical protein
MSRNNTPNPTGVVVGLGIYLVVLATFVVYFLFALWPVLIKGADGKEEWSASLSLIGHSLEISHEGRLILLVMLAGALGSYVHATTSFVTFVGNRRLMSSWVWWYVLRPFIGVALALVFYFVIRGGLLSAGATAADVSPFGIVALAALAGMFSKQATDKLRELFDDFFKTEAGKGDDVRRDKLGTALPVKDLMIPVAKIVHFTVPADKTEADVKLTELLRLLGGVATRIPVFDASGALKYVIHQSVLYKFIAELTLQPEGVAADTLTLAKLLESNDMRRVIAESSAFVAESATLGEAKRAMEETPNCQDVFVTENASRTEPVLGWLTNVDVTKHSQVS